MILLLSLACAPRPPEAPPGMVAIPAGTSTVGSPRVGDQPPPGGGPVVRSRREVALSAYAIDRYEVTRADYAAFLAATGYRLPSVGEDWAEDGGYGWSALEDGARLADHPVVLISWYDAAEYCLWRGARLPTEAEWEVAALGGDGRAWPWGDTFDPAACNHGKASDPFFDSSDGWEKTSPVGRYPAGPRGLYDAYGNAWEWVADAWGGGWADVRSGGGPGPMKDPRADEPALYRGARGGSYYFAFELNPDGERNGFLAELRRKTTGVRCAVSLPTGQER